MKALFVIVILLLASAPAAGVPVDGPRCASNRRAEARVMLSERDRYHLYFVLRSHVEQGQDGHEAQARIWSALDMRGIVVRAREVAEKSKRAETADDFSATKKGVALFCDDLERLVAWVKGAAYGPEAGEIIDPLVQEWERVLAGESPYK